MKISIDRCCCLLFLALLALLPSLSGAQGLPTSQMRIVIPFAPGGTTDIVARLLSQSMADRLHRPVIVDNRPGAGGSLATDLVVRADPDGATLLLHTGALTLDPALKPDAPYKVLRDLTTVTTVVQVPFAILVNAELPVRDIAELVAYAKAHPGKLNFGSAGTGTSTHVMFEQFLIAAGVEMTHVPYKGSSQAALGLMSNDVQVLVDPLPTAVKYTQAGKVRALAITTAARSPLWPDLPTLSETHVKGLEGFDSGAWYGLFVSAKTPAATVAKLNQEVVAILRTPAVQQALVEQGMTVVADTPQQGQQHLAAEIDRMAQVVRTAGIKLE